MGNGKFKRFPLQRKVLEETIEKHTDREKWKEFWELASFTLLGIHCCCPCYLILTPLFFSNAIFLALKRPLSKYKIYQISTSQGREKCPLSKGAIGSSKMPSSPCGNLKAHDFLASISKTREQFGRHFMCIVEKWYLQSSNIF